ncbi:hypothetical protein M758_9G078500 [Ceratodon purpureus]|nr:hypothetical protein M758_9G078500 [Ceratodon purpureus]
MNKGFIDPARILLPEETGVLSVGFWYHHSAINFKDRMSQKQLLLMVARPSILAFRSRLSSVQTTIGIPAEFRNVLASLLQELRCLQRAPAYWSGIRSCTA